MPRIQTTEDRRLEDARTEKALERWDLISPSASGERPKITSWRHAWE